MQVWKFLLGFYEYHSTYAEREFLCYEREHEYQTVKKQWQVRKLYEFLNYFI